MSWHINNLVLHFWQIKSQKQLEVSWIVSKIQNITWIYILSWSLIKTRFLLWLFREKQFYDESTTNRRKILQGFDWWYFCVKTKNVSGKSYKHKTIFGGNIFLEIFCSILPNISDRPIVYISQSLYLFCVKRFSWSSFYILVCFDYCK